MITLNGDSTHIREVAIHINDIIDNGNQSKNNSDELVPKLDERSRIRLIINENEYVDFMWGEYYAIGTAAYWVHQAKQLSNLESFQIGSSLLEEVVFCILGGYGIPAEIGNAAFQEIKKAGIICNSEIPSVSEIEDVLRQPIAIHNRSKPVHYRFPKQKSQRIHSALIRFMSESAPLKPFDLRNWLLTIPGIGLKTASWIVRNYLGSDLVAIVDIHIQRAGVAAGFFSNSWKLPKDYELFERAFVSYAQIGGIPASILDSCIWDQMHSFGRLGKKILPENN